MLSQPIQAKAKPAQTELREWRPHRGPQEEFCRSSAFELLYGGMAGGGKSQGLLLEASRYVHVPRYRAVLFRRIYPSLERSLIGEAWNIYPALGGSYNQSARRWTFPSGAVIEFGHLEHEHSVHSYQSAEYAFIGFDELTEFLEGQYLYMLSRLRTTAVMADGSTVPCVVRSATNPGGVGHAWVKARWLAWLGDQPTAKSGAVLWYDADGREVKPGTPGALSRQFIAAKLSDNPALMRADPGYAERLARLPLLVRKALAEGSWDLTPEGNVFKRAWFSRIVTKAPDGLRWVRYYDLAASMRTSASRTATIAAALDTSTGTLYFRDGYADHIEWPEQEALIARLMTDEPDTVHAIEQAMHGLPAVQSLSRRPELAHVALRGQTVTKDKLSRALAWSARAERGQVALVEGPWIPAWLDEVVAFDGKSLTWDDQVDAASGCVEMLKTAGQPIAASHVGSKATTGYAARVGGGRYGGSGWKR